MPLSVTSPLVANDIYNIKMLKDLKVWLLIGRDNDKIVIKIDAVDRGQIKSASPVVKAIDPNAAVKILTPPERAALNEFVALRQLLMAEYKALGLSYKEDQATDVADLKTSLTFPEPFVKMEAKNLRDLEGALVKRMAGDKTDLQAFVTALTAAGGLEKLGKVIAADMFNGNTDRFFPGSKSVKTIGGKALSLRCLVNVGNVFVVINQNNPEMGALDFMDPNSRYKDINALLATKETATEKWPARVLVHKRTREAFAEDCIHDLEAILDPKKSKVRLLTKLGRDAPTRLAKGMVAGAKLIKLKLEQKYAPNNWTPGITERYNIISQVH